MWFSTKKSLLKQGVFQNYTDNHTHILFGVDDGVKTLEDSITILNHYEQYGVKDVWLTPHVQEYMPNETEELRQRYEELTAAYHGNVRLHLAAEYMIDTLFTQRLNDGDLLYHGDKGNRLLVETSYFNPPLGLHDTLRAIMQKGITPILAHPERYTYMSDDEYTTLQRMGVIFQLNLPSLLGLYGKSAKEKAWSLLNKGYYSFSGTDIHSPQMLPLLEEKGIKSLPLPLTPTSKQVNLLNLN